MGNSQSKLAPASPPLFEFFTKLPVELRLEVYEYTLSENVQPVLVDRRNDEISEYLPELNVGLLQVSHQIRHEIASMYYRLNSFRFLKPEGLVEWLSLLDAEQRNQIYSIGGKLRICEYSMAAIKILAQCGNLQQLVIPSSFDALFAFFSPDGWSHHSITVCHRDMRGVIPIAVVANSRSGRLATRFKSPTRHQLAWMNPSGSWDLRHMYPEHYRSRTMPASMNRLNDVLRSSGWPVDEPESQGSTQQLARPSYTEVVKAIESWMEHLGHTCPECCKSHTGRERVEMEIEIWERMLFTAGIPSPIKLPKSYGPGIHEPGWWPEIPSCSS